MIKYIFWLLTLSMMIAFRRRTEHRSDDRLFRYGFYWSLNSESFGVYPATFHQSFRCSKTCNNILLLHKSCLETCCILHVSDIFSGLRLLYVVYSFCSVNLLLHMPQRPRYSSNKCQRCAVLLFGIVWPCYNTDVKCCGSNGWSECTRHNAVLPSTDRRPRWSQSVRRLERRCGYLQLPRRILLCRWWHRPDHILHGERLVARSNWLRTYVISTVTIATSWS